MVEYFRSELHTHVYEQQIVSDEYKATDGQYNFPENRR